MRKQILAISMGIFLLPSCTKKSLNKIDDNKTKEKIKMDQNIKNEEGEPLLKGKSFDQGKAEVGSDGVVNEELVGVSKGDMIGLSSRKFVVSSKAQTIEINTEKQWWWLNDIIDNGEHPEFDRRKSEKKAYKFTGKNFDLERPTLQKMMVHLKENTSGKARKIQLFFQAGNYFDEVVIEQK